MYDRWGKRAFDVAGAMLLLLAAAPLLAAAALGVCLALGRPVLFRQQRTGRDGVPFTLFKLRSLRDGPGPDAARLGRFGRLLRASAIDELPQLVNVLRGEMSLVGPRPLLPDYLPRFTPAQAARLLVRPGLCGLAQAAERNAVPWRHRLALDARYATARPGLRGDVAILLRCAGVLLRGRGATAPGHATMPEFRGAPAIGFGPAGGFGFEAGIPPNPARSGSIRLRRRAGHRRRGRGEGQVVAKRLDFLQEKILKQPPGHAGRWSGVVIIRVSPQWQVTIPKALRDRLGQPRQMEARLDRLSLVLTPILMDSPQAAERALRPDGVTAEVILVAMDIVAARRRKASAAAAAAAGTVAVGEGQ